MRKYGELMLGTIEGTKQTRMQSLAALAILFCLGAFAGSTLTYYVEAIPSNLDTYFPYLGGLLLVVINLLKMWISFR